MDHWILLDDVTSQVTGEPKAIQNFNDHEYGIFQVDISGTATVVLEGRISPQMTWATIDTYTASGAGRISLFPHMRARVSAYTSGTIRAELDA